MSYDYLLDTLGKFRKRKTRFTELEIEARSLLTSFVERTIDSKEFAAAFDGIRVNFLELRKKDGQTVFDEDTPLWLNSLLGLHYMKWLDFQQVKWYFEKHPDELVGEMKAKFESIRQMGYDEEFLTTCKNVLEELRKSE